MSLYALVPQTIPSARIDLHPADTLHTIVAEAGIGPDYPAGEVVLGCLRDEFTIRAHRHTYGLLFTDRRLFGAFRPSGGPHVVHDFPYAHVVGARIDSGVLTTKLHMQVGAQTITLEHANFAKSLDPFFRALATVPPAYRGAPLTVPPPAEGDPLGALGTMRMLISGDPRPHAILVAVHEAAGRGEVPPDVARNVVERAFLLDRFLRSGRGMRAG